MTSTQIVPRSAVKKRVSDLLNHEGFQQRLRAVLPSMIKPERFALVALGSLNKNPALLDCTANSLVACMLQSAVAGLEVDSGLGHAYLVPFRDKKSGTTVCTLILGYRGIVQLLYRSAQVSLIQAQVVRAGDEFAYSFGLTPKLHHIPDAPLEAPITHAYAMLKMKDGNVLFDVMTQQEIESIRRRSRAGTSGPWVTDYAEMAKKTVLRRLAKLAPMSVEDQRLVTADEHADAGLDQSGVFTPAIDEHAFSVDDTAEDDVAEDELTPDELEAKREYEAEVAAGGMDDEQPELTERNS